MNSIFGHPLQWLARRPLCLREIFRLLPDGGTRIVRETMEGGGWNVAMKREIGRLGLQSLDAFFVFLHTL